MLALMTNAILFAGFMVVIWLLAGQTPHMKFGYKLLCVLAFVGLTVLIQLAFLSEVR